MSAFSLPPTSLILLPQTTTLCFHPLQPLSSFSHCTSFCFSSSFPLSSVFLTHHHFPSLPFIPLPLLSLPSPTIPSPRLFPRRPCVHSDRHIGSGLSHRRVRADKTKPPSSSPSQPVCQPLSQSARQASQEVRPCNKVATVNRSRFGRKNRSVWV